VAAGTAKSERAAGAQSQRVGGLCTDPHPATLPDTPSKQEPVMSPKPRQAHPPGATRAPLPQTAA
jgi:hypothetical protein